MELSGIPDSIAALKASCEKLSAIATTLHDGRNQSLSRLVQDLNETSSTLQETQSAWKSFAENRAGIESNDKTHIDTHIQELVDSTTWILGALEGGLQVSKDATGKRDRRTSLFRRHKASVDRDFGDLAPYQACLVTLRKCWRYASSVLRFYVATLEELSTKDRYPRYAVTRTSDKQIEDLQAAFMRHRNGQEEGFFRSRKQEDKRDKFIDAVDGLLDLASFTQVTVVIFPPPLFSSRDEEYEQKCKANPEVSSAAGETGILSASKEGHLDMASSLLEKGVNVNTLTGGTTPLYAAAFRGHVEAVRKLLAKGADHSIRNSVQLTPLYAAADCGHVEVVKLLIEHGAEVGFVHPATQYTPIMIASIQGHTEVAKILLEHGASPHPIPLYVRIRGAGPQMIKAPIDYGPLYVASQQGYSEIVKALLEHGANASVAGPGKRSALYVAATNGHAEVVNLLLQKGIAPDEPTKNGLTALYSASGYGYTAIAESLIKHGADVNRETTRGTPLWVAASNGRTDVVKLLLAHGADIYFVNSVAKITAISVACINGHVDAVKAFLDHGADLSSKPAPTASRHPLHSAVEGNRPEVVDLLLANGINPFEPSPNGTPFGRAAELGHTHLVKTFLSKDANPSTPSGPENTTPLGLASASGHLEVVQTLLAAGADPSIPNASGETPLCSAARFGHHAVVTTLLEAGADPNTYTHAKRTPLHEACRNGLIEVVRVLLAVPAPGVEIATTSTDGWSPITSAAGNGFTEIVEALLDGVESRRPGASRDLIETSISGCTVLALASWRGHVELVRVLIARGADVNAVDEDGLTPLWGAKAEGHSEVVDVLVKAGAKMDVFSKMKLGLSAALA
ncbi:ankyrin repeat domain-containing protein [Aspergillus lucknowensis]|uniref:Ankyrin repeat-containing domain protein n=1 Tax=Aspergillus lucknowensis TaxID=176173 RepID=A0ABR4LGY0_9EURO